MTTSDERMRVLKMVEQGKISAEVGSRLLDALGAADRKRSPATYPSDLTANGQRRLRVRVTDANTGRNKVNVTIPMSLIDVGLKMGARFAPQMEGFDQARLAEMVRSGVTGKLVEVQDRDDGELVEIYIE